MDPARAAAYLRAYEGFQAVQGERAAEVLAGLPAAAAAARQHGWDDICFVLTASQTVDLVNRCPDRALVGRSLAALLRQAEALAAPPFVALALGLQAITAGVAGDTATVLADVSRGLALLDDRDQPPLDRATAYMVVAGGLCSLRLWELVDEVYATALALGPDCPVAVQDGALAVNRVLIRLEWGLAQWEAGEEDQALEQLRTAAAAAPAALALPLPVLWRHDVEAVVDLVRILRGEPVDPLLAALDGHRRALLEGGDLEVLPVLDAVRALALSRAGRPADARAAISEPAVARSSSSGLRSFPLWVRAEVLSAGDQSPGSRAQREHAAVVSRMHWEGRLALLAAARVQIAAERHRADHERLSQAVHTDALTGLENRRHFDEWLARPLRRRSALLLVDLDGFKDVNDRFGHASGDDVLRRVGQLIRGAVRPGDLALRLGGDEFAVLIEDDRLTGPAALRRGRLLRAAIVTAAWSDLHLELALTASVGVAVAGGSPALAGPRAPARTVLAGRELYRMADEALYRAKQEPAGVVFGNGRAG